ncbi:MAG TPA: hypothetical protein VH878_02465 [Thermodesulfobacteriota bacterium]|jgi:hypothetical protein
MANSGGILIAINVSSQIQRRNEAKPLKGKIKNIEKKLMEAKNNACKKLYDI